MSTRYLYYTAMTLDGFLADEHDSLDWLLTQPIDERGPMNYTDFLEGVGVIVMGATTYQWVLNHNAETGEPWSYTLPCFVFTHRDLPIAAHDVRLVHGTPAAHRATLEELAGGATVWVVGGGDLAAQFAAEGMLDEIIVSIAPVTLGRGRPLFTAAYDLELLEVDRNRAFACARYAVRGARANQ